MEKFGMKVPLFSYAKVSFNGEYFGLYLAVESILEPYLERNFEAAGGDLYKSDGNTLEYILSLSHQIFRIIKSVQYERFSFRPI